jgi:hypothetical protein
VQETCSCDQNRCLNEQHLPYAVYAVLVISGVIKMK